MPKLARKPPRYTLHAASGNARVRYHGRDIYLGLHGTPESDRKYAEFVAAWSAQEPPSKPQAARNPPSRCLVSIAELIEKFWARCRTYYRRGGKRTGEAETIRYALRPLLRRYGALLAAELTPKRLKEVREDMIALGWWRRYVNSSVCRIRLMFAWAVEEELVPPSVAGAAWALQPLAASVQDRVEIPCRPNPNLRARPGSRHPRIHRLPSAGVATSLRLRLILSRPHLKACKRRVISRPASSAVWSVRVALRATQLDFNSTPPRVPVGDPRRPEAGFPPEAAEMQHDARRRRMVSRPDWGFCHAPGPEVTVGALGP
jgi:hypothetical protein